MNGRGETKLIFPGLADFYLISRSNLKSAGPQTRKNQLVHSICLLIIAPHCSSVARTLTKDYKPTGLVQHDN